MDNKDGHGMRVFLLLFFWCVCVCVFFFFLGGGGWRRVGRAVAGGTRDGGKGVGRGAYNEQVHSHQTDGPCT